MTATTLRSAGRCRACRAPVFPRPNGARVTDLPPGARFHAGRGLCTRCHPAAHRAGTLIDFARHTLSRDELLDDWVLLRDEGLTYTQAAARIGMPVAALKRALNRARADGDPRAEYARNRQSTGVAS